MNVRISRKTRVYTLTNWMFRRSRE